MKSFFVAAALAALTSTTFAQTFTSCDPMNTTCPPDLALGVKNYTIDLQRSEMTSKVWNQTAGSIDYDTEGAYFTINERGDAPTVQSNFHIMFGTVEVIMKAATGQGIVSSIVMQSDDLDEVDWEWIGGNNSYVQTNYFGKGNTTSYDRAVWHPVNDAQGLFHNYTVDWSAEKLDWYIDGELIRTLLYEEANGGYNFPQTPCDVRLGIWAGGDPKNNKYTIEWAGGEVDYSKAPFNQIVQSVRVSDAGTGTQYEWTDRSGSYQSIKALNNTKPLNLDGDNGGNVSTTLRQKINGMPTTTKIAIAVSVLGVVAICAIVFLICCIKQRRLGKHEKLLEDAKFEKNQAELMSFRAEMGRQRNEKMMMMQQAGPNGIYGTSPAPSPMGQPFQGQPFQQQQHASPQMGYAPSTRSAVSGREYRRF